MEVSLYSVMITDITIDRIINKNTRNNMTAPAAIAHDIITDITIDAMTALAVDIKGFNFNKHYLSIYGEKFSNNLNYK